MSTEKLTQHVVLSDHHFPYDDEAIIKLSLEFVKEQKPAEIHLLGDLCDFYPISRFDRDPERALDLQNELDKAVDYLADLRKAAPKARIRLSAGNHEVRLRKYLWTKAAELSSLRGLTLQNLLSLDKFDISWHPYEKPYTVGSLLFTHGSIARKHSGYTARGNFEKFGCNVITGHCHRLGAHFIRTRLGTYGAWENGCLCRMDPSFDVCPNWQHGWSVIWFHGREFHVDQVCVVDGKYVYHGKLKSKRARK